MKTKRVALCGARYRRLQPLSHLSVGDVFPEFTYDTPYTPQSSFYQLLEEDERPLFLIFLRNFGHPLTRHYIIQYVQSFDSLLGARLACVVRSKPQTLAKNLPEGTLPFPVICDAEGALYDFAQVQVSTKRFTCYSLAGMRILKQAAREGYEPKKGEPQQLPLTLLLEAKGKVLLAHYGTSITDQPEDCEAMQLVVEARRKELRRQEAHGSGGEKGRGSGRAKKEGRRKEQPSPQPEEWQEPEAQEQDEPLDTLDFVPVNIEIPGFSNKQTDPAQPPLEEAEQDGGTETPQTEAAPDTQDTPDSPEPDCAESEEVDVESEALRKYREVAEALFSGGPKE